MKYLLHGHQTSRLVFREIRRTDFLDWLEFFKDHTSFQYWNADLASPEVECEQWYKKQFARFENDLGGMNALIEKYSGNLVGHMGLVVQKVDEVSELEVAYSLLGSYRGRGYATEGVIACRDFAFQNKFSESLISIISLTNLPSARVAIRAGMSISKQTIYNNNPVNIFRLERRDWKQANV
jgi:[ribosomal protein S5]-alanine N-acetyltransferase